MKKVLLIALVFSSTILIGQTLVFQPSATNGKDAFAWSNGAGNNYGTAQHINVYTWTNNGILGVKRSFLEFDLSVIPQNAVIDSAFLKLYYDPITNEGFTTHSGNTVMEVRRVTSPWVESSLSWNNQPSFTTVNQVVVPAHSSNTQDYNIEVTALVDDMLTNSNYGFVLKMKDEENYYRGLLLASSDHPQSSLHPRLEVHYTSSTNLTEVAKQLESISVFPNPSNGLFKFRLDHPSPISNFTIEVFSINGNKVNAKVNMANSTIDMSGLAKGVYFAKFSYKSDVSQIKRLIVN